jgi:hypothetical protein
MRVGAIFSSDLNCYKNKWKSKKLLLFFTFLIIKLCLLTIKLGAVTVGSGAASRCGTVSSIMINVSYMKPPWRNRLARSAVNRKVGSSSPPGGAIFSSLASLFSLFLFSSLATLFLKQRVVKIRKFILLNGPSYRIDKFCTASTTDSMGSLALIGSAVPQ